MRPFWIHQFTEYLIGVALIAQGLQELMVAIFAAAVQPWFDVPAGGRLVMLVMLVPLGFLWFYTDWAERRSRKERRVERASIKSEDVGRSAGRMAGNAFKAIKKKTQ